MRKARALSAVRYFTYSVAIFIVSMSELLLLLDLIFSFVLFLNLFSTAPCSSCKRGRI